jgi:hypothetical protein
VGFKNNNVIMHVEEIFTIEELIKENNNEEIVDNVERTVLY